MLFATLPVFALAFAGLSFSQTTTISLYIPGADTQPLIGSIIGSDSAATTYALQCVPGTDSSDCGFPGIFTLTEGPETVALTVSDDGFTALDQCSLATRSAVCFESNTGNGANDPGSSTVTYNGTDYTYMAVTITGNSEIKSGPPATGTTISNSGVIKSGPTATGTASTTMTSGNVASQTSSTTTSSSQAGVAAVTGNAAFAMGGLAVAMAVLG